MTSQEKDKFIAEKLGHKWEGEKYAEQNHIHHCACGNVFSCPAPSIEWQNDFPDFTSETGRVQLLKLISKKHLAFFIGDSRQWVIELMTDDTGKFRDAVYRWLGGEE